MSRRTEKSRCLEVVCLTVLLVYYELYRWLPLGWWNGEFQWRVHNDQFYANIVIGFLLLLMIGSLTTLVRAGMWIGVFLLALWIIVHLHDWWIPCLRGTGPERDGLYFFYGSRTQILPSFGRHRPPNGGHAVLDLFVSTALVSCLVSSVVASRTAKEPDTETPSAS